MVEGIGHLASEYLDHEAHQRKDASEHLTEPHKAKSQITQTLSEDEKQSFENIKLPHRILQNRYLKQGTNAIFFLR